MVGGAEVGAYAEADPDVLLAAAPPVLLSERELVLPTVSVKALLSGTFPPVSGQTEIGLAEYAREIVASGFPGLRHLSGRALRAQLDGYLQRIVDRDFPEQERAVRRSDALRRWLAAYAAATSTTTTFEKIRAAASGREDGSTSRTTTNAYRDVLERLWIVDAVPGWLPIRNHLARLTQGAKHHLADHALAAPRDGALLGRLFESLVTLSVRVYAQHAEASVRHLRTRDGREEIDLILERQDHRVLAMEVKLSATVNDTDVRHLLWLREKLGDDVLDLVLVTTGGTAYRRPDGVAVVPAVLLGP